MEEGCTERFYRIMQRYTTALSHELTGRLMELCKRTKQSEIISIRATKITRIGRLYLRRAIKHICTYISFIGKARHAEAFLARGVSCAGHTRGEIVDIRAFPKVKLIL